MSEDIKIAKGKSGQTDIAAGWNPNCALVGSGEGGWDVKLGGATVSSKNGYSGALSGEAGWSVNQSGTITVPSVANTGNYTAFYYAEECFDPILMEPGANNAYQYEFEVVCLTVEISATKYESNPDFSLLVCRAIASGGTPPYTYLWMAQGTGLQTLEGQGTEEVDVRVNAGASGSVSLLVTDKTAPTLCTDSDTFAIPAQPLGVFNVTVSASSGAGNVSGTRDTMRFTATVEATATTPLPTPPPASIIIQAHRNIVGLNYTHQLTATLIPNLSPHKYQAQWDITRDMGKWSLQVEYPYESNTANFKIDKRSQIVQVANSWLGATAAQVGGNCNDFVGKVYNHVGLPLTVASTQAQYSSADTACAGDGCILFYSSINAPPGNVAHDAIEAGTQRININSNTTPGEPVVSEDITAGVLTVPVGVPYKTLIEHRSTVDLDKD